MRSARRPQTDVIVVVLDTARLFDIGALWPASPDTMPVLGQIARESIRFPECTTPSPWTLPSHASLFTGLSPSRHGATEATLRLGDGPATMAELLGDGGWTTVALSCNDLVAPATGLTRGYVHSVEEREAAPAGIACSPLAALATRFGPARRRLERRHAARRHSVDHGGRRANLLARRVLERVRRDRPLHLLVNYLEPHLPYRPPGDLLGEFLPPGIDAPAALRINQSSFAYYAGEVRHGEREFAALRALYRAKLRYLDGLLGQLVRMLREAGRWDGALVIVTSDHGENIGDHGLIDHQFSLHDTLLRVPLLVRLPGGTTRCDRAGELAQTTDVLPTVADVCGLSAPDTDGSSLLRRVARTHAVAEYLAPSHLVDEARRRRPEVDWGRFERGLRSVRTATRKYIAASDGRNEMYELDSDPMETRNLFGGHPEEVRLARVLRSWEQKHRASATAATVPDAEVTGRLAALGYVE